MLCHVIQTDAAIDDLLNQTHVHPEISGGNINGNNCSVCFHTRACSGCGADPHTEMKTDIQECKGMLKKLLAFQIAQYKLTAGLKVDTRGMKACLIQFHLFKAWVPKSYVNQ